MRESTGKTMHSQSSVTVPCAESTAKTAPQSSASCKCRLSQKYQDRRGQKQKLLFLRFHDLFSSGTSRSTCDTQSKPGGFDLPD
jgi:hypothetical protein